MFSPVKRGIVRDGFALDFDLSAAAGGRSVVRVGTCAVKRWTSAWSPRITYARTARREFKNLVELERAGVAAPKPLACFWTDFDAGLVTEWIDGAVEARERPEGIWPALAAVVAKAIDAGLDHPDLHLGNVLVRGGEVFLVDLQEARFVAPSSEAAFRTLGFLMHSIVEVASTAERVRFLRGVRERSKLLAAIEWREVARGVDEAFRRSRLKYFRGRVGRVTGASASTVVDGAWVMSRAKPIDAADRKRIEDVDNLPILKRVEGRSIHRWRGLLVKASGGATRAWRNAWALKWRGLPVAEPRGLFGRKVVVADWVDGEPLPEYVEANFGGWPRSRRLEFLESLAALVRRLHARGVFHHDLKGGNILVTPGGFVVLDLDRVDFYGDVPLDARLQNLAQLVASVAGAVSRGDRLRFLRFYAGRDREFHRRLKVLAIEIYRRAAARSHRWP